MADTDSKLRVTELDFDSIKSNLRDFLRTQPEFSDYNFEGSGMSVLLDLLAYNTHYMGYYMNMIGNEMFIDTAMLRRSVVSHAKLLGYTPRSRVASKAIINLSFTGATTETTLTIPRFTRFVTPEKDGRTYIFSTTEQLTIGQNATGVFTATNVEIKEGQPQAFTYTYNSQINEKQIIELPELGIDVATIKVQVQTSSTKVDKTTFTRAEDATEVLPNSNVFYLEENRNGKYQIYFGNDIVGKKLLDGNIVIVTYLVASGSPANRIRTFRLLDQVSTLTGVVTLVSESSSGAEEESINEIKLMAPKAFIAQNRAVTKNDYISLINRKYPYFSAVTVWGGEENNPPVYGKIFFSVRPLGNYQVTTAEINNVIENVIKPYSVLTVQPEYVAPDYNMINLEINVVYDPTKTSRTEGQVKSLVRQVVLNYANTNFNSFDAIYKNSKIVREIDNAEKAIENNEVNVILEKRFRPILNQSKNYVIDFSVPLAPGTNFEKIYGATGFRYADSTGVLRDAFLEEVPLSYTGIFSVDVNNPGTGFTTTPTLTVEGDGTGAKLRAVIVNGRVSRVDVLDPGTDYTSASITITGGGGSGAVLTPNLDATEGKLRIYYFDSNKVKKIIEPNAGTVYYDLGRIELNSFKPSLIKDALNTMVIKAHPKNNVFSMDKNKILALDVTDPTSITIKVSAIET